MNSNFLKLSAILALCTLPAPAPAAEPAQEPLTLGRVIELSSTSAPGVRLAVTRIAEGEAKLAGAKVRTLENPTLDLSAGPRTGTESSVDLEVGMEIPVEFGSRRDKRIAAALAGIQREKHATEDVRRQSVAASVAAYYLVLQAEERQALARERKSLAEQLLGMATQRHASGDVAKFEVNLAKAELARADSEVFSANGKVASAKGALARTLGLPSASGLRVSGSIKDRSFFDAIHAAPAPTTRTDLLTAQAEVESSRAAVSLAEADRRPDVAFRVSYKREGDDNVALGGISVTLPFFNPRRAAVQETRVQHERAQLAADISRAALSAEIEGARNAYAEAAEAVRRMETDGLTLQQENDTLAHESYRAGKINLSTLLQLRRDALETRREYLERLLEAAEAGVELASATGIWSATN